MNKTFSEGVQLYRKRNYKEALAVFLSIPKEEIDDSDSLAYFTGLCYMRLNRYEEALLYLEHVVTSDTDSERVNQCRMALVVIYSKTERTRLADFELDKLIESGFINPAVYAARAYSAWIHDRGDESVSLYEKVLEMEPENATALNGLGYVLACMGKDLTKALSLCKRAVDSRPDNYAFLDSLGWVYYKLGLMTEAKTYIKRAKERSSMNPEVSEHYSIIFSSDTAIKENRRIPERGLI